MDTNNDNGIVLQPIDSNNSNVNTDNDTDTDAGPKVAFPKPVASNVFIDPRITKVKETVMSKVDSNEIFTAFDITKDLRSQSLTVKHDDIKSIVREMWYNGDMIGYKREIVRVGGAKPYVYLPVTGDANSYRG